MTLVPQLVLVFHRKHVKQVGRGATCRVHWIAPTLPMPYIAFNDCPQPTEYGEGGTWGY